MFWCWLWKQVGYSVLFSKEQECLMKEPNRPVKKFHNFVEHADNYDAQGDDSCNFEDQSISGYIDHHETQVKGEEVESVDDGIESALRLEKAAPNA